jgi:hypothetical protein
MPSPRVQAWLDYLRKCKAGTCDFCDGVIGPAATLANCCLCSRESVMAKATPIVATPVVKQVPNTGRQLSMDFAA